VIGPHFLSFILSMNNRLLTFSLAIDPNFLE